MTIKVTTKEAMTDGVYFLCPRCEPEVKDNTLHTLIRQKEEFSLWRCMRCGREHVNVRKASSKPGDSSKLVKDLGKETKMYFLFGCHEGTCFVEFFKDKEEAESDLTLWFGEAEKKPQFLDSLVPQFRIMDSWADGHLLIKGEIVIPQTQTQEKTVYRL